MSSSNESKEYTASTSSSDNISNLQENFSKQQKKITALKELVTQNKSTSSAQEKVKNIAQRLTLLKSKARNRGNEKVAQPPPTAQLATSSAYVEQAIESDVHSNAQTPSQSFVGDSAMPTSSSTPNPTPLKPQQQQQQQQQHVLSASNTSLATATTTDAGGGNGGNSSVPIGAGSEKIQLLRHQMEQNRLLMAQRASSKQHLEQLVTQLREKFDTTQQCLEDTNELGKSMTNLSALTTSSYTSAIATRDRHRSATDLSSQTFSLEKERIKFLENRCRLLEKQLEKERQVHATSTAARGDEAECELLTKRAKDAENKVLELQQAHDANIQRLSAENERLLSEIALKEDEINRLKLATTSVPQLHAHDDNLRRLAEENERLLHEIAKLKLRLADEGDDVVVVGGGGGGEAVHTSEETVAMDEKLAEMVRLRNEIDEKLKRINDLETVNDMLETTRNDLSAQSEKADERLAQLEDELNTSNERLQQAREEMQQSEEKCAMLQESLDKMQLLTTAEARSDESAAADERTTDNQVQAEMAKQIQALQDEVEQLQAANAKLVENISERDKLEVSDASIAEKIAALEATIASQREDLQQRTVAMQALEEKLMEKTIELNVLNANYKVLEEKLAATKKSKPLFSTGTSSRTSTVLLEADGDGDGEANLALREENQKLRQKLDESNKAMMKLKLKCKQTEKQLTQLQKSSDLHAELAKVEQRNDELQQKITELEVELGQWQLAQVDEAAAAAVKTTTTTTKATASDEEATATATAVAELEAQLQTQADTVRLLQEEKFEHIEKLEAMQTELETLRDKLQQHEDSSETARVQSQMSEIHLEEQVEDQAQEIDVLRQRLTAKEAELQELQQRSDDVEEQKQALVKKLDHYINENIELLDKMEKLSKSSSSAESIEIVERLTQQERAEIDVFTKRLEHGSVGGADAEASAANAATAVEAAPDATASHVSEVTQTDMGTELSENLTKLREESSELMNKIELFTTERREVLEKMEHLTNENQDLQRRIEELNEEKSEMETSALLAENAKSKLEQQLQELTKEKELLASQVAESTAQKAQLSQDLSSLQKSSEVVAALDSREGATLFDKCEKSLSKLNSELEAYRKANDKNAKFNASKKLAKEAKNAHTQLSELLQKVKEASTAVETVTVVETVVAVTAPNGKALAEYEQLTAQNRQLKSTIDELRRELQDLRELEPSTVEITELPSDDVVHAKAGGGGVDSGALVEANKKLQEALSNLQQYETQMAELQSTVEDLRTQLVEARQADAEKSSEIAEQQENLAQLRKEREDVDRRLNEMEMNHEKQMELLIRQRKELEGKCETYEGEMEILQTLVTEQKQQLIEAYKESEHELNMKMLDLQSSDQLITQLRIEIRELKSSLAGDKASDGALQQECEKLRESLRINKVLVAEQVDELANKQETIDTLNQQIIDLYKTMEENTNKVIEKEDELADLMEKLTANERELDALRKDNNEQKSVVDKLLSELHADREHNTVYWTQLQSNVQRLEATNAELKASNQDLEQRNKDQLEKLKKYAANLKKRAAQCLEYEGKVKTLEKGALEAAQTKEGADDELNALRAVNEKLNETVATLEQQREEQQNELAELQRALQTQTMDMLEASERAAKLEVELNESRTTLEQKLQEIVQLQNALAASQEQDMRAKGAVWDNDVRSADAQALAEERVKCARLNKELTEKTELLQRIQTDLQHAEENLAMKVREINVVRAELMAAQEQASDWGANAFPDIVAEAAATATAVAEAEAPLKQQLQSVEQQLNNAQNELLQLQAQERELKQANAELLANQLQRDERIQELQAQLAAISQAATTTSGGNEELQAQLEAQEQRLNSVTEELKAKALKFEKSKAVIKERNNQIHRLQAQIKDLQEKLTAQPEEVLEEVSPAAVLLPVVETVAAPVVQGKLDAAPTLSHAQPLPQLQPLESGVPKEEHEALQQAYGKLQEEFITEKENFQMTLSRLETLHDGIKAKLQENMSYIESLELENGKYKDKICRLEECVATFEERRASMERRANLLDEQLQTRTDEFERSEDALVYRLNMLSEHDDVIGRRLLESQEEKEELQERVERLLNEQKELKAKHSALEKEFQTYRTDITANANTERQQLQEKLQNTEAELQRIRGTYDAKLAAKTTEIDELECELSDQLDKMNAEKRSLLEDLERTRDECTEQKDELVRLRETVNSAEQAKQELEREVSWLRMQSDNSQQDQFELQELRMQTLQDKTELDNLRHQIETLAGNHELELQGLRTQIAELDTLRMQVGQNQTDDQVFIETENKRLTDLLAEKEALIENYQRQNLQLQMTASSAPAVTSTSTSTATTTMNSQQISDPFALAFGLPPPQQQQQQQQLMSPLGGALVSAEERDRLERELNALQSELLGLREANSVLEQQLQEQQRELDNQRAAAVNQTQMALQDTQISDVAAVVPPPPGFFASDQMAPSPFDEIVQARTVEQLEGAVLNRPMHRQHPTQPQPQQPQDGEQRIIEDLQRNVSDLEKHAQDLEQKLAARNHSAAEYEERLRELDARLYERDQQLQALQGELLQWQQRDQSQAIALEQQLTELRGQLALLQQQLVERDAQLQALQQQKHETELVQAEAAKSAGCVAQLQVELQQRETELAELRRELAQATQQRPSAAASLFNLESQILPDAAAGAIQLRSTGDTLDAAAPVQFQPTLDMFFGGGAASGGGGGAATDFERLIMPPQQGTMEPSSEPVIEEAIVPKKAYICHPKDSSDVGGVGGGSDGAAVTTAAASGLFDLGDDWGDSWGGTEGAAEEAHFSKTVAATQSAAAHTSLVPREQQLEIALQEEREHVQELQLSLERSEQQKQELQVKSGKMVKKLKEYKAKLDEQQAAATHGGGVRKSASVESNSMFADLDAAIQDELKSQIARLEARLEEQQKAQELLAAEKEKLLKRIDVLTAGTERMSEMKERQDMDVQMYQARIRELQDKLNRLDDWGTDEPSVATTSPSAAVTSPAPQQEHQQVQQGVAATPTAQLEAKVTELMAELADANGDKQELQALLDEERSNVARAEETVLTLQQRVAFMDEAVAENQTADHDKYHALQQEHGQLQQRFDSMQQTHALELSQLRATEAELNAQLAASAAKVQELQAEIDRLQMALESMTQAQGDSESQLLELRTRLGEVTQANSELQAATETAQRGQDSAAKELQQQLQDVRAECERLQLSNSELDAQLQQQKTTAVSEGAVGDTGVGASTTGEDLSVSLLEKELEILHLKQRIEDLMREDQTEKLVLEILAKNQDIHMLRMQVKHLEDDKVEMENNLTMQITKEMQTAAASGNATAEAAQHELQQQNEALTSQLRELQAEKASMEEELKVLNNHVLTTLEQEDKMKATVLELDAKNIEIAELRNSLESLKAAAAQTHETAATPAPQVDVVALNAQWETLVEQRCGEIAQMWRSHLEQREREFEAIEACLKEQIAALLQAQSSELVGNATVATQVSQPPPLLKGMSAETTTSTPASESTSPSASSSAAPSKDGTPLHYIRSSSNAAADAGVEGRHHRVDGDIENTEDAMIERMQAALESQEIEIVTLKEQLAIRSAEYARLAAQYDPFKLQSTTSHRSMLATAPSLSVDSPQARRNPSPADSSVVPKSELDLALYMLHQRDMRCEEMTVELVSLLEERDTLQLKLSNTLRQLETVKTQTTESSSLGNPNDSLHMSATGESPMKPLATTGAAAIVSDSDHELTQKLVQLQTVNHSKDKVIKEERDQRIRQMEKIQQDMAKIPSAAVSELVGSDPSHTSQSPSSTLLNWLWGNQPPNPAASGSGSSN